MPFFTQAAQAADIADNEPTLRTILDWLQAEESYLTEYISEGIPELQTEADELVRRYEEDLTLLHNGLYHVTNRVRCSSRISSADCELLADKYERSNNIITLLNWSEAEIAQQRHVLATKPAAATKYDIDLFDRFVNHWALPASKQHAVAMQMFRLKCHEMAPIFT